MRTTSLQRLAVLASAVFIADFATKQWALRSLGGAPGRLFAPGVHLAVVNNTGLAWGLQSGGFELQVTALATLLLVALVIRIRDQLAQVDAAAPVMLALLVGAGAANLADALIPPHGVVDFIGITTAKGVTTSFNVADIAAAIGVALLLRTAWRITQTMRGRRTPSARSRPATLRISPMRHSALLSAGHALLAMCGFVWLYSMLIVWMPDAGRSAPNSLLCGVAVFGVVFVASQARLRLSVRRAQPGTAARVSPFAERVVLDGSLPAVAAPVDRVERSPRRGPAPSIERPIVAPPARDVSGELPNGR